MQLSRAAVHLFIIDNNFCLFSAGEYKWELEQESQDSTLDVPEVSAVTDSSIGHWCLLDLGEKKNVSWDCREVLGNV